MAAQDGANLVIAKDSFDVLITVFELGSSLSAVSEILKISGSLASAFPVVGAILALVGNLLPNVKHEEILSRFNQLSYQIDLVRDDIKNLGDELGWQQTEHHYRVAVNHIELGIRYCLNIGRAEGENSTQVAKNILKNLCANEKCTLDLNNLLKGIAGKGLLTSESILDKFDAAKAKGNRKKISPIATRLLQVASGGILVISTYEAMMYGQDEAKKFIEDRGYLSQLQDACRKAQSVLDRCIEKFKVDMLVDLNLFLDEGGSNQDIATKLSEFMSDKYDWLENFVLVYDDMWGSENHHIVGYFVDSLHRNGKCGFVFYRTKGEAPRFSDRVREVNDTLNAILCNHARNCNNDIQDKMAEKGVEWIGCAVIRREPRSGWWQTRGDDPNISWEDAFSTETVIAVGTELWIGYSDIGATIILLLE